jgi:plasmid stability protein
MRTTLSIDDDVAAAIKRRRASRGTGLKQEINDLLRAGLAAEPAEPSQWDPPTVAVGRVLLKDQRAWKELLDDEDDERALPDRR